MTFINLIRTMCWLATIALSPIAIQTVYAVNLELTQGVNKALPIGIDNFGSDPAAVQLVKTISDDLKFSGQFNLIPIPGLTSDKLNNMRIWTSAGADSVLMGHVYQTGYGQFEVKYELFDAPSHGRLLLSKTYKFPMNGLRTLAHHISDEIYYQLTGIKGIFSTRIAYIIVNKQGSRTEHSLIVSEVDGNNPQRLLLSTEPIMSPSWSPDGRYIAYVSFERKRAQIYTVEVATGQRRLISTFPGINGAPAWSPDGRQLAVVLSKAGSPNIYTIDLNNGAMKQLTFGTAINTEPRYSPDGHSMLFTSGRGGSPQIYRLDLNSLSVSRVTYDGNYNARATETANRKQIVVLHRGDGQFTIGVQDAGSSHIVPITFSGFDESPTVAPNGRFVLYATRDGERGALSIVTIDGRVRKPVSTVSGDAQEPAWSPFLG